jgi:Tol biopolymer transport system component
VTHFEGPIIRIPRWSPDGKYIAFSAEIEHSAADIYIISADGAGRPHQLTIQKSSDVIPSWSNDGQWIYFRSISGEGTIGCYKIPIQGGTAVQVTNFMVRDIQESPDGKWLYYKRDKKVCRMPIEGGEEEVCVQANTLYMYYKIVDDGIFYKNVKTLKNREVWGIEYLNFKTEMVKTIFEFEPNFGFYFDISPDRRWLIYTFEESADCDIYLIENWR